MTKIMARLLGLSLLATALMTAGSAVTPSWAASGLCYTGINLSGGEYGDRGGVLGTNFIYPSENTVRYFAAKGMNVVRLPFKWERLQPTLNEPLDATELQNLKDSVELIRKSGMSVVLDPHNFGYYDKIKIGTAPATELAFADLWARLAVEFANQKGVIFGLMNEPYDIGAPDWLNAANAAIRSIRTVGARNLILVPGTIWTGAWSWNVNRLGSGSNGSVMLGIRDPLDFYAFEVHQYLDTDFSGTHATCEGADQADKGLVDLTNWLRQNHKRGFLGEFGAAANQPCLTGLQKMVDVMAQNSDVWLGWTYWAAGDWWPPAEPFNVQPRKAPDRPQMKLLENAARKQSVSKECSATIN